MRRSLPTWILLGIAVSLVPLSGGSPALAQRQTTGTTQGLFQKDTGKKENIPIHIVSDRMVADNKNLWVHFIGNVTATRGELVMHSDRLEVYRDPKSDKIERIEAIGRVDISRGGKYATADKAIFYDAEQKIVLLGNPKAWENDNIIVGHKMNFFLETDQLIVEGDSNRRVDVVLYPAKEKERNQKRNAFNRDKAETPQADGNGTQENGSPRNSRTRKVVSEPQGRQ